MVDTSARPSPRPGKRILVVEDSLTVRQQVARLLTEVGFEVMEAPDGQTGLELIDQDASIALVICDLNMPIMNGMDMIAKVKSGNRHATLPILMLTTESEPGLITRARKMGARGWLVKPFQPTDLVAAVRRLTGGV